MTDNASGDDGDTTRSALLCCMPAVGHVGPLSVIGAELRRRGWRVRMLTGHRYRRQVESAGIEFTPLPSEADTLDDLGAEDRHRGLAAINDGVEEAFIRPALPASRRIDELLAEEPVDVVFHDMTFVGVQTLFGRPREARPLVVMCGIGPAGFSSRDCPPYGMGILPSRRRAWGRMRDAALNRSARLVLRRAHASLEAYLERVGAPPLDGAFFMDVLARSDLLAQFSVPEFEYERSDAPAHLRFYGPLAAPAAPAPAPDWWGELREDLPLVHVTQGTVANSDFSELVAPTLEALADEAVQVVVTSGGADPRSLPVLPVRAFAAPFLDYSALLPRTSVFVTNGGYGGLHQAMRHGVPIVVAGDSEDKVETSARVQWSGAGIRLGTGRPRPAAIRRAVRRVLDEPSYAATSRRIGRAIAASTGAAGLVDDVEAMLEPEAQLSV